MARVGRRSDQPYMLGVLAVLVLAELSASYESSMIYAALPHFLREFRDATGVGWLVTSYLLTSAAFAAICGRLGDIYGRGRLLAVMLAISAAGSLLSANSEGLLGIAVGRSLQGSAGAILPLGFGLARQLLPARFISIGVGILAGTSALGAAIGFLAGALLIDHASWHWIFILSAGLSLAGLACAIFVLPRDPLSSRAEAPLDVVGGAMFLPGLFGVLLAMTNSFKWGWFDARNLALLAASLVGLFIWSRYEIAHSNPLIDVRLLGRREVLVVNCVMALCALSGMQVTQVLTVLIQQPRWTGIGLGASATFFALIKMPAYFSGMLGSPTSGYLAGRYDGRRTTQLSAVVLALGMTALVVDHVSPVLLILFGAIAQFGVSMILAAVPNVIISVAPEEKVSEATGLSAVIRSVFMGTGSQIVFLVLATSVVAPPSGQGPSYPSASAYWLVFMIMAFCAWLAVLFASVLPARLSRQESPGVTVSVAQGEREGWP